MNTSSIETKTRNDLIEAAIQDYYDSPAVEEALEAKAEDERVAEIDYRYRHDSEARMDAYIVAHRAFLASPGVIKAREIRDNAITAAFKLP